MTNKGRAERVRGTAYRSVRAVNFLGVSRPLVDTQRFEQKALKPNVVICTVTNEGRANRFQFHSALGRVDAQLTLMASPTCHRRLDQVVPSLLL